MKPRSAIAEINISALSHNINEFKRLIPHKCRICAAVKSDAYGHGVEIVIPIFKKMGVEILAVFTIHEAMRLRSLDWQYPILLLGSELAIYESPQNDQVAEWLVENQIQITVARKEDLALLASAGQKTGKKAAIHFMLDTGMTRDGIYEQQVLEYLDAACAHPYICIQGLYTHFAAADHADKKTTLDQLWRFSKFLAILNDRGIHIPFIHAANSSAAIDLPQTHFTMIRPGISLYGCHSSFQMLNRPDLRQVMRVVSFLTLIKSVTQGSYIGYGCTFQAQRDMVIGLVPIGYADGYDRRLSNVGKMIIADRVVPVVGRISMDQTVIDLTDLDHDGVPLYSGLKVTVIDDRAEAPNNISALCRILDTVPQEIMTRIGPRVLRVPVDNGGLFCGNRGNEQWSVSGWTN